MVIAEIHLVQRHLNGPYFCCRGALGKELQKNRALLRLKGIKDGTKLKLQDIAMAIVIASRFVVDSTQSKTSALHQMGVSLLFSISNDFSKAYAFGSDVELKLAQMVRW